MKDLPILLKVILNIVFYIIYWAIVCFIVGVCMYIFAGGVDATLADKIGIFSALLVLLLTIFFRKHCYIGLKNDTELKVVAAESYTEKKRTEAKKKAVNKKTAKKKEDKQEEVEEDDEIKIYVEKEIK